MLTYGEITRDPAKLPQASLEALLARGFTHFMGNEQASKVVSKIRAAIAGPNGDTSTVTREAVNQFRADNADQVAKWTSEVHTAALAALDGGTVGVRASGGGQPRLDPVTAAMRGIARGEVQVILKSNGLKWPGKDAKVEFAGGAFTGDELIDRRLAKHGDRIRREAEKSVAAAARKRAEVEKTAGELDL